MPRELVRPDVRLDVTSGNESPSPSPGAYPRVNRSNPSHRRDAPTRIAWERNVCGVERNWRANRTSTRPRTSARERTSSWRRRGGWRAGRHSGLRAGRHSGRRTRRRAVAALGDLAGALSVCRGIGGGSSAEAVDHAVVHREGRGDEHRQLDVRVAGASVKRGARVLRRSSGAGRGGRSGRCGAAPASSGRGRRTTRTSRRR